MGAMAICLELRHLESYGAADPVSVLMLLDRRPDVFLARRSGAEGFVVKPLDPQRMRQCRSRTAARRELRGRIVASRNDSRRPRSRVNEQFATPFIGPRAAPRSHDGTG